jgi:hypothetical protein
MVPHCTGCAITAGDRQLNINPNPPINDDVVTVLTRAIRAIREQPAASDINVRGSRSPTIAKAPVSQFLFSKKSLEHKSLGRTGTV